MTRPPKIRNAVYVDLSQYLRAVVYGPGDAILLRSAREPFHVTTVELDKLIASREALRHPEYVDDDGA
jgi:hypothetical protein